MPIIALLRVKAGAALPQALVSDAVKLLGLRRLDKISQLQVMTGLKVTDKTPRFSRPHTFGHSRLEHSLLVAKIMLEMLQNLGFAPADVLLGVLAAIVHDALTSAGGDIMKMVDPEFFDEDRWISKLFHMHQAGWQELCAKYQLPAGTDKQIEQIVQGKNLLGDLLNIADSCSYMILDLAQLESVCKRFNNRDVYSRIFAAGASKPCIVWKHIGLVKDHAVITDPQVLENFLRLRACLWADLYLEPGSKFLELLMARVIVPYLFMRKKVDRGKLLRWNDIQLRRLIKKELGIDITDLNFAGAPPVREAFAGWMQALACEDELVRDGWWTLVVDAREQQKLKPKTNRYFVNAGNGAKTFEQAFPLQADEIKAIANQANSPENPLQVYSFPPVANLHFEKAWREARKKWRNRT